jgi:hypothetical protein
MGSRRQEKQSPQPNSFMQPSAEALQGPTVHLPYVTHSTDTLNAYKPLTKDALKNATCATQYVLQGAQSSAASHGLLARAWVLFPSAVDKIHWCLPSPHCLGEVQLQSTASHLAPFIHCQHPSEVVRSSNYTVTALLQQSKSAAPPAAVALSRHRCRVTRPSNVDSQCRQLCPAIACPEGPSPFYSLIAFKTIHGMPMI